MGQARSTNGDDKHAKITVDKAKGKMTLGIPQRRSKNNTEINLKRNMA
jgi:hypothetical protein